jgi:hypothetical protein
MLFSSALMTSKIDGCNFVDCDIHADISYMFCVDCVRSFYALPFVGGHGHSEEYCRSSKVCCV